LTEALHDIINSLELNAGMLPLNKHTTFLPYPSHFNMHDRILIRQYTVYVVEETSLNEVIIRLKIYIFSVWEWNHVLLPYKTTRTHMFIKCKLNCLFLEKFRKAKKDSLLLRVIRLDLRYSLVH